MNLKSGPRIRKFTALMCATVLQIILIPPVATAIQEASVSGGTVLGVIKHGVVSFKGIPFAAPPIGLLRWKAPQPVVGWSGVKNADAFAEPCAQSPDEGVQGGEESAPTIQSPWFPSSRFWSNVVAGMLLSRRYIDVITGLHRTSGSSVPWLTDSSSALRDHCRFGHRARGMHQGSEQHTP